MKNTLETAKLDTEVIVSKINIPTHIKRRILDLGIIEGTKIKPVFRSPLGDPTAYEVRGTLISLRKEDSKDIEINY